MHRKIMVAALVVVLSLNCFSSIASACTIFSASNDEMTLVGNNEDWEHNDFSIVFYPEDSFGYGHVAFVDTDNYQDIRAGMNTEGIFIDSTAVRASNVTIDPEKPFLFYNFFKYVLWTCASVNETIEMFKQFNFAETWFWQILVADRYGDSVVIAAGPNETVWYIRGNETYQLITNGNIAYPELGQSTSSELRYLAAQTKLDEIGDNITIANARDVLDAAHSDWTAFSTVYDLVNRDIYIYFNHDYTKEVSFNLDEELVKGSHAFEIYTLFQEVTTTTSSTTTTTTTTTMPSTTTTESTTNSTTATSSTEPESNLLLTLGVSFSIVFSSILVVLVLLRRNRVI